MKRTFEQEIEESGRLIYTNVGDSMMPLLRQHRDLMIISRKPEGRLKRYDIPLYKRDSGQYVLHRILRVRKDGYVICGDNRCKLEYDITDRHIIGVLTGVVRDGKEISVKDWKFRLYSHIWCDFFPIRVLLLKTRWKLSALKRKLRKK